MTIQINSPDTKTGNSKKVFGPEQVIMKIRVFYPNPLNKNYDSDYPLDFISKEYDVEVLEINDPIYHQLVFTTTDGTRHQIIGLAYHIEEKLVAANGVEAIV